MDMKTKPKPHPGLHVWELALLVGLAAVLLSGTLSLGEQTALSERVVRLHVLANSDSQEDQARKRRVRDRVLAETRTLLEASADREEAAQRLTRALPRLERLAAEEIAESGYDYPVSLRLEETAFPTRTYDGFTLPAGKYLALRVLIGAAEGQNWWCVVFPPLCAAASEDVAETALAAGLSQDQVALITEESRGYELRLKSVELWEALRSKLGGERE